MKKKLKNVPYEIHDVMSITNNGLAHMQYIHDSIEPIPEGNFSLLGGILVLPKRRRGQSFRVRYSTVVVEVL